MLVIHVPVTRAVKKYFLIQNYKHLVDRPTGYAIYLNQRSFLGNLVHSLLTHDLRDWKLKPPPTESLVLLLSKRYQSCYITERSLRKLAFHLDHQFKLEMCLYVDMAVKFGGISALQAVNNFCQNFGIEEQDYGQDSMYRYYTRYGKAHHIRPNLKAA